LAQLLNRDINVFVSLFNQHNRNIIADRIFATTPGILADKPDFLDQLDFGLAGRTDKDI